MNRLQLAVLLGAIGIFFAMYFGCETKSKDQKTLEKSRVFSAQGTDIAVLLKAGKEKISEDFSAEINAVEELLSASRNDTAAMVSSYKSLAALWYQAGNPEISGYYAGQIAEIQPSEDAWARAGTTYAICVQRKPEAKVLEFCTQGAVTALEKAISLNPENIAHRVNLAVVYAENPPKEDVMRGVTMLLELSRQYPDDIAVLNNLGRLANKTGQYDRALKRFERVLELDPGNPVATCLLAETWEGLGDNAKATMYAEACKNFDQ